MIELILLKSFDSYQLSFLYTYGLWLTKNYLVRSSTEVRFFYLSMSIWLCKGLAQMCDKRYISTDESERQGMVLLRN